MTTETTIDQTTEQTKKRKRLTLEEQIARQTELLEKDKENLAKKQKRLRSLNASKMNKDRIQAQKKRNSMLIQLGFLFINIINWMDEEEGKDEKLEFIDYYISELEELIKNQIVEFNNKFLENKDSKEAKISRKSIYDNNIMVEALKNIRENYLKTGKAKI